jgi:hypothetical protein
MKKIYGEAFLTRFKVLFNSLYFLRFYIEKN